MRPLRVLPGEVLDGSLAAVREAASGGGRGCGEFEFELAGRFERDLLIDLRCADSKFKLARNPAEHEHLQPPLRSPIAVPRGQPVRLHARADEAWEAPPGFRVLEF